MVFTAFPGPFSTHSHCRHAMFIVAGPKVCGIFGKSRNWYRPGRVQAVNPIVDVIVSSTDFNR